MSLAKPHNAKQDVMRMNGIRKLTPSLVSMLGFMFLVL